MYRPLLFSFALAVLVIAPGCASSDSMAADQTLVEVAADAPNLSTLVQAIQAANLVETLSGPGPFTVFAPDDAAFAEVPEATLQSLLQPANQDQLRSILTYHVVPGRLMASDLSDGQMLTTVNGEQLEVEIMNGTVMVGGATVTQANVSASNGVAHIINGVLMP